MKENRIEETIKQLKLILKVRKEQKDIIECAGGSCINCDPDIKALSESIDILSDYKRVLKENEELEEENKTLKNAVSEIFNSEDVTDKYIPVSLVEEKLKKEKLPNVIVGGRRNAKTLEYGRRLGRIEMCKELLESEE